MNPTLNVRWGLSFSRPYYWKTEIASFHPHSLSDRFPLFQRDTHFQQEHILFFSPGRALFTTHVDAAELQKMTSVVLRK